MSNRRLYLDNWAILAEKNQIKWHFGDISEEKLLRTLLFVNALRQFGTNILKDGLGLIRLQYPTPHPTRAREILIVNLMETYTIIISDPLVTTRLIDQIDLGSSDPIPPLDDLRSILAGAASVMYSQFYTQSEAFPEEKLVDQLFQEAVNAVTFNQYVTVGNGQCSFSAMSLEELLFFHALLKHLFESYVSIISPNDPWGIISSSAGTPIYLAEGKIPAEEVLLSSLASVIINYCELLFEATPSRLIFGLSPMRTMDFIVTEHNFFILHGPQSLFTKPGFIKQWKGLPKEVSYSIAPEMKKYIAELLGQEHHEKVKAMKFHQCISALTKMGAKKAREFMLPTLILSKEKVTQEFDVI